MRSVEYTGNFEVDVLFGDGLHCVFSGEASKGGVVKSLELPLFGKFKPGAGVEVVDGWKKGDGSDGQWVSGVGGFGNTGDGYV